MRLLAVVAILVACAHAAVVKFGTIGPVQWDPTRIPVLVQVAINQVTGLQAAFYEANMNNALNGDQVQLVVSDLTGTGVRVNFGQGAANIVAQLAVDHVTAIVLPSVYAIHAAVAITRPQNVTVLGGQSPETVLLYAAGSRNAVNFRLSFSSEISHMLQFAANSGILCNRFGLFYYNTSILLPLRDIILENLRALGFGNVLSLPMQPPEVSGQPPLLDMDTMMAFQPQCVTFISAADLVAMFTAAAMVHPLYNPDMHFFGLSAANLPAYPPGLRNVYIVQQFPDPTDLSYIAVRRYQQAQQSLLNRPGGFVPYPNATADSRFNYDAFEGYIIGRMALEVLKRVPDYSPQTFLNTVYNTKMFVVDDIIIGPYSDGCVGRSGESQLPCVCNSGGRFVYISKINNVTGVPEGVSDNTNLGERKVAASEVPLTKCTLDATDVFRPYVFHQLTSTTDVSPTTAAFSTLFRASVNAVRASATHASTVALRSDFATLPTPASFATAISRIAFRYAPLAFVGSIVVPLGNAALANDTTSVHVAPLRTVIPLTDAEASFLFAGQSPRVFELAPVLADLVHALAAAYGSAAESDTALSARVVCSTDAQCDVAVKSLHTFGVEPVRTQTAPGGVRPAVAAAAPKQWTLVVSTNASDVESALLAAAGNVALEDAVVMVAAPEDAIDEALRRMATTYPSELAALAATPNRVLFATTLTDFWFTNTSAATAASATTLTALRNAYLRPTTPPTPAHARAFYLAAFLAQASAGLTTFTPTAFANSIHNRQTISTIDVTAGPFYGQQCASRAEAARPERECECNKGPRRFSVYSVEAWASAVRNPAAPVASTPRFTYSHQFCGVQYQPLPTEPSYTALAVGLGVGLGAFLALVIVAVIAMRPKSRNNSAAPKDAAKPFAVVFTDIQSSTALWARAPMVMGPAVDAHHEVIRELVKKYAGYEVKTIGDSFMVVFAKVKDAVDFAVAVQRGLHAYDWGTRVIDQTYRELAQEQAEDDPAMAKLLELEQGQQHWNGLRVRVGVHLGHGSIKFDEVTLGYDYYGTVVNTAARVEGVGHGGQVLITGAAKRELAGTSDLIVHGVTVTDLGQQPLRGLDDPLDLWQLVPSELNGRRFGPLRLDVENAAELESDSETTTEQETGGLSRKSSEAQLKYFDSASSVTNRAAEVVEPLALRYARHDRKNPAAAYSLVLTNFHFLKTLFSTANDKYCRTTTDQLLAKWRVKAERPVGKKVSRDAVLDYNIMQVVVKATMAAEASRREFTYPNQPTGSNHNTPRQTPRIEVASENVPGAVEA